MPTYAAHCQPPFQFIIADIQQFSLQCDFNENSINYVLSCTRLPLISQSRDPIYAPKDHSKPHLSSQDGSSAPTSGNTSSKPAHTFNGSFFFTLLSREHLQVSRRNSAKNEAIV